MPTGHTTPLPLATWDRDTLRAVAVAYRRVRRLVSVTCAPGRPPRSPSVSGIRALPEGEVQQTVALMISAVACDHPTWLLKGVSAVR